MKAFQKSEGQKNFSIATNRKIITELMNILNAIVSNANLELPFHGVVLLQN
jgi:hypothetical protein